MKTINERLNALKVIPVITIKEASKAVKLAETLITNGLPCAEITFRTEQAALAIKNIRQVFPNMLICAGTVLTIEQANQAIDAGVDFIVSPGFNPTIVKYCQQRNIPIIPGINTPSLVEQAMEMRLDTLKFFPAESSGGISMLKALTAVYPVQFMPTGSINPNNINDYLAIPSVLACGGTWMVPNKLIDNEQWDELAILIKEAISIVA